MHLGAILLHPGKVEQIRTRMQTNETMTINKYQRSRLTFDLSAKVAHIGVPSIYLNIIFSETTRPIEFKFYMATP